ncbi:MAG: EAL domain-containing protein, partial [Sulfuritalea sp.]|nr:EAL domain-containing protein [Sulfuritalea sp.]
EAAGKHLQEVAAAGVTYSLDHVGSGLSPLSCLKRFPVKVIKIDHSYIGACTDNPDTATLIEAIINMAHSIGLLVTAEGVETRAQRDFLRMAGCDYLQGFLIGRPHAAAEFEKQFIPIPPESSARDTVSG